MPQQVLSILQVNEYIKSMMDRDGLLTGVAVRGEISNYKVYPSGHHYFTLKDENASIRCVMFRGNAMRLRFSPQNGMQIIAMGKISVYPRDGAYQLYCSAMAIDGVGDLHEAFEQLKAKLAAKGMFDPQHKKAIPAHPKVVGVVTSSAGAAIHDILRILRKRYPLVKVRLLPVRVQGAEAPDEIASAIAFANRYQLADLLIVGRGGGSIEDLWAFNDERVAQAIFDSQIPIISAVGHEPDVTISDYVADLRAATPSNAAELAVPDQDSLRQNLDAAFNTMLVAMRRQLSLERKHLQMLASNSVLQNPTQYISQRKQTLTHLTDRLIAAQRNSIAKKRHTFISLTAKLDAMSPLKVLTRGYSMTQDAAGKIVRSIDQVATGDTVSISVSDGRITTTVTEVKEDDYGKTK